MKKLQHGGKRDGAGAKPLPKGEKKIQRCMKLAPDVDAYLRTTPNQVATVENTIRRSKAFKDWKAEQ